MAPSERFPGWRRSTLLAGVLMLGLAACGDKPAPEPAAKPIPPVTQEEPKKDEMKMAEPQTPAGADANIAAKVKDALGADGGINVHRIDVNAESGIVTLYGTADTSDQRAKAAQIAAGVAGVKSVENKLAIVAGS
ncbi:MAG: BON domain-containing protein [Betaproteobacteria bacterium]|nr:BON domain-containing protein [Betaproteobacteria bacterium]MDH3437182.1 BON domain-containing protein [Betaproteobacteria bacterium]